jgi:TPR repeat protein
MSYLSINNRFQSPLIKELIKFALEIKDEKDPNKICEKAKEVYLRVENAESLYKVGRIYSKYGKKDEAFQYFAKAADSGHKFAQFYVALHYYQQNIQICNYEYVSLFFLDENKKIETYYQLFDNPENIRNNIFLK